jgi:hypothetical protein
MQLISVRDKAGLHDNLARVGEVTYSEWINYTKGFDDD